MAWVFNPFTGTFDYSIVAAGGVLPPSGGGTGTSTVFTTGSVVFAGASGVYTQDNANFFWDDTNNRLGLGTAAPAVSLHVVGNVRLGTTNQLQLGGSSEYIVGTTASNLIQFFQSGTEAMRFTGANNLSIGSVASAAKLYVVQTAAGSTCGHFVGVSGAKLLIDYIGSGTNYFDGGIVFRNTASGTIMTLDNTSGNLNVCAGTATPAGGSATARMLFGTTAGFGIYYGSGAPTVSAAKGSLYLRSDGTTTNDRMYVNTNGSTTWTNVTTGA
jgi:hypothetical protein